jgi:hypothetical protein
MMEQRRMGSEISTSTGQKSLVGGTKIGRGSKRPHSWIFTESSEEGVDGTKGRREQVGPEHGRDLLGIEFGAARERDGCEGSRDDRST